MPTKTRNTRTPEKPLDFSKGVVGKYYERAIAARNVVVLDADLVEAFPDSASVNAALRTIKEVAMRTTKRTTRVRTRTKAA
jgi:hypothetical protein